MYHRFVGYFVSDPEKDASAGAMVATSPTNARQFLAIIKVANEGEAMLQMNPSTSHSHLTCLSPRKTILQNYWGSTDGVQWLAWCGSIGEMKVGVGDISPHGRPDQTLVARVSLRRVRSSSASVRTALGVCL